MGRDDVFGLRAYQPSARGVYSPPPLRNTTGCHARRGGPERHAAHGTLRGRLRDPDLLALHSLRGRDDARGLRGRLPSLPAGSARADSPARSDDANATNRSLTCRRVWWRGLVLIDVTG